MFALWKDAASGDRVIRLTGSEAVAALVRLFEDVAGRLRWRVQSRAATDRCLL